MTSTNKMKVWIQGTCFRGSIISMLAKYGGIDFKRAPDVPSSDMILYTGGADVSPQLYYEPTLPGTSVYPAQDRSDKACYDLALRHNKYQVGICRGAQFLNVMNGGKLWQDVNNHAGFPHNAHDVLSKKTFPVSSLHHQGIILNHKDETNRPLLLAYCNIATRKVSADNIWKASGGVLSMDVEAYWYEKTRCLGVQWHPECGPDSCVEWFYHYLEMFKDPIKKEVAA